MTWWLRARRIDAVTVSICVLAATGLLAPTLAIPMPALFAAYGLNVPLVLLAPLAVSTAVGWGLGPATPPLEQAAVRRIDRLDRAYVLAAVAAGVVAVLLAAGAVGAAGGPGAARSLVACTGMLLVGRWLLGGNAGAVVPVAVLLAMALFGGDADGQPRSWAFALAPVDSFSAWLLSTGLLVAGLAGIGRDGPMRPGA